MILLLMNKFKLSAYTLVLGIVGLVFASCTSEFKYEPAAKEKTAQVYFPNTAKSKFEVTAEKNEILIPIMRIDKSKAVDVPLIFTAADANGKNIIVPTKVSFKAGENKSTLVLKVNTSKATPNSACTGTIVIDKAFKTEYGLSKLNISVFVKAEFVKVTDGILQLSDPSGDLGNGKPFGKAGESWLKFNSLQQVKTSLEKSTDGKNYRLTSWFDPQHPIEFTVDNDGYISLKEQFTGLMMGQDENIKLMVVDIVSLIPKAKGNDMLRSKFDATKNVAVFKVIYKAPGEKGGIFGAEVETFVPGIPNTTNTVKSVSMVLNHNYILGK